MSSVWTQGIDFESDARVDKERSCQPTPTGARLKSALDEYVSSVVLLQLQRVNLRTIGIHMTTHEEYRNPMRTFDAGKHPVRCSSMVIDESEQMSGTPV